VAGAATTPEPRAQSEAIRAQLDLASSQVWFTVVAATASVALSACAGPCRDSADSGRKVDRGKAHSSELARVQLGEAHPHAMAGLQVSNTRALRHTTVTLGGETISEDPYPPNSGRGLHRTVDSHGDVTALPSTERAAAFSNPSALGRDRASLEATRSLERCHERTLVR
jgi:hypothetical protein